MAQRFGLAAQPVEIFGMAIPMIINSLNGDSDVVRDNGLAPKVNINLWYIKNEDEFNAIYEMETNGSYAINADEIKSLIKELNPEADFSSLTNLYGDMSIETIEARRQ